MKKIIGTLIAMFALSACAADIPRPLIQSCLADRSVESGVTLKDFDTTQVSQEDDYKNGYNASYLFESNKTDVGYAENKNNAALIYNGDLYLVSESTPIGDNNGVKPSGFSPDLASWSMVSEGNAKYLCVSFNFGGVGRSGSFQNVRGAYLLNISSRQLYFVVRNIGK